MAIKDLEGYVPEVSLRYFESSVLPPLSPEQLTQLSAAISPLVNTEEDRWTSFDTDPCDTEGVEDVVFAPFPVLLNSIMDAVAEDLGHTKGHAAWKAQGRPTEVLHFENNPHATLKPDAFAALRILRGLGMPPRTLKVLVQKTLTTSPVDADASDTLCKPSDVSQNAADVVFVCEFKKKDSPEDVLDVSLSHLSHMLPSSG